MQFVRALQSIPILEKLIWKNLKKKKSFLFKKSEILKYLFCWKNAVLLVLPKEEISLQPELSRPSRFRTQGGSLCVTDGRKEHLSVCLCVCVSVCLCFSESDTQTHRHTASQKDTNCITINNKFLLVYGKSKFKEKNFIQKPYLLRILFY